MALGLFSLAVLLRWLGRGFGRWKRARILAGQADAGIHAPLPASNGDPRDKG